MQCVTSENVIKSSLHSIQSSDITRHYYLKNVIWRRCIIFLLFFPWKFFLSAISLSMEIRLKSHNATIWLYIAAEYAIFHVCERFIFC